MRPMCVAAVALMCAVGRADTLRWVNAAGGGWDVPGNWDLGRVPTQNDQIVFDLTGAYTVALGGDRSIGVVRVRNGSVTLAGPGVLTSVDGAGPGGVGLYVGDVGGPATLTLTAEAGIYHVSSTESIWVYPGSAMELRNGGVYTSSSDAFIMPGALLRIDGGAFNPGTTKLQGTGIVTAGVLTGEFTEIASSATLLVDGPTAEVRTQEGWFSIGGDVTVTNGGRLNLYSGTPGLAARITVLNGGYVVGLSLNFDSASRVVVGPGGVWRNGGSGQFHGPVIARAGADFELGGRFHSTIDIDQAAAVTRSWIVLEQGLTVEVDGLAEPAAPLVPAYSQSNSTYLTGPLTVRLRNANALRVGDVIPIFAHRAGETEAFSGLVAPAIGGGRVLTLVRSGSPAVTSIVVAQGEPACFLDADFNGDGDTGTDQDIEAFFACLGGSCCGACASADFNGDGDTGTDQDIEAFFRVLGGHSC